MIVIARYARSNPVLMLDCFVAHASRNDEGVDCFVADTPHNDDNPSLCHPAVKPRDDKRSNCGMDMGLDCFVDASQTEE
ncbi:MAG: hypothetical protein A2103_01440 [Gammaproteobacteria bacterium GWF2_41_13]|nr:MAG: hypothetical protein A2103_01440 [Gammaproteobacteria bacterium GWF2_41_13]